MVGTMVFNKERLEAEAPTGFALATDIAEWLVKNGVPFRHAHELSGACVKIAEDRGQELWDLADDDFIEVFKEFLPADKAPEVREVLSTEGSVSARNGNGRHVSAARARADRFRENRHRTAACLRQLRQRRPRHTRRRNHCSNNYSNST